MIPEPYIYYICIFLTLIYYVLWAVNKKCICTNVYPVAVFLSVYGILMAIDLSYALVDPAKGFNMGDLSQKKHLIVVGTLATIMVGIASLFNSFKTAFNNKSG
jgi:hypothetical protein